MILMINQNLLRERTQTFLSELHLPVTKFVANVGIARTTYYRWQKGDFDFGEQRAAQIDSYLKRYGF